MPGDLITDLENAGVVGDPLYEVNFRNSSIWDSHDWTYSTTFAVAADTLYARDRGADRSHRHRPPPYNPDHMARYRQGGPRGLG